MIPVAEPFLTEEDHANAADALASGWISSAGSYLDDFESSWAAACARAHGVAVANGTVALELAVAALRLPPGSEIVMPSFTIISCALAAIYNDCRPVFVDADPDTWCMDVGAVAEHIGPSTRALMPVHIYGHPVEAQPLLDLAAEHGLAVVEDAAEAHGARYRPPEGGADRPCGSFGDVSTFSFYANKLVTTGEGGMVLTDDASLAERLRSQRNLCFQRERRFHHTALGHNFRLTNLQAALGVGQVRRLESIVEAKRRIAGWYLERLGADARLQLPTERPWVRNVYWVFGVVLRDEVPIDAQELAARLASLEVETRPFFLGMHEQPILAEFCRPDEGLPVTERLARRGLYLPAGLTITESHVDRVCDALRAALP